MASAVNINKRRRYKGKVMTEKQHEWRKEQIEGEFIRKKRKLQTEIQCVDNGQVEGRRIVESKVMARHLYCSFCQKILFLDNKKKCIECFMTTTVPTGNKLRYKIHDQAYLSTAIVFFDLETGGFFYTDDILQVALKYNNSIFNRYANPTQSINPKSSAVHGLTSEGNDLYRRGVRVQSSPLESVLNDLLIFLRQISKPCLLVAHNCSFDSSRLLLKIKEVSLIEQFREIVVGFADTLSLFRKRFPDRKGRGSLKLTTLSEELINLPATDAHDAISDVILLEKLVRRFISYDDLVQSAESFDSLIESMDRDENSKIYLQSLNPLSEVVSKQMLKRMAYAAISYESILSEYQKSEKHAIDLLEQRVEGKAQLIKSKKVLNSILSHLSEK